MRLGNLLKRTLLPAALCGLAVSACGSQPKPPRTTTTSAKPSSHGSDTVAIYSSLPRRGSEHAAAIQIQQGIQLALKMTKSKFRVEYHPLSDSPRPVRRRRGATASLNPGDRSSSRQTVTSRVSSNWSPGRTVANAAQAARDPQTVAYIGDLDSGATELSLPILNQAGIAQITPGSGYPGLTDSYKGITQPAVEPSRYYPESTRTLLRMIPSDIIQASAVLRLLSKGGCQTVAAWQFGNTTQETALFNAVAKTAPLYAMKYVQPPKLPASATAYGSYASTTLKPLGIHCAVLVGHVKAAAEMLTTELRLQLGPLAIVGTTGFCNANWARGIPKVDARTVLPSLYCMTPYLPLSDYPGWKGFSASFSSLYGHAATTYSLYGYRAAEMVLRALRDVTSSDDDRSAVLSNLVSEFIPNNLAPGFTFDHGSVESTQYAVNVFSAKGALRHHQTVALAPGSYLLSSG